MAQLTWRRIVPVTMISAMLVLATLLMMNRSSSARPLSQPESEQSESQPDAPATGLEINMLGPDTTLAGRTLTFTILVTNSTGQALQNVVMTDTWYPSSLHLYDGNFQINGLPFITHTFRPTATQPYIRWELGTLGPGAAGSIVMTTFITSTAQPSTTKNAIGQPTILANVAAIETTTPGVPSANDGVNTLVVGPVMYLEKLYTPTYVRPGRLVTFTLKLVNRSTAQRADAISSTGTIITEVIPAKTKLWSVMALPGVTYDYLDSTGLISFYLANPVLPGQTMDITFTARVSPTLKNRSEVATVRNNRSGFGFRSVEVTIPRPGEFDVILQGDDVVEKSVQVDPPPPPVSNPPRTFPNRIVTYTIGVYNPFTTTLSGFRLTDTLPQYPTGGPYFIYSDTLPAAGFSAPTVFTVSGRTVAWDLPDIEGWGVYSFTVRVRVPPNFDTATTGRTVDNAIYGTVMPEMPVVYDNAQPIEARVIVYPQIVPIKSIAPGAVFSGYPETYTLWLTNTGTTTITNIAVTDTLPSDGWGNRWEFEEMLFGPTPVYTTAIPPQVIWQGITVPAGAGVRLQFRVRAYGVPPPSGGNYCNTVAAYSPDTFIPTVQGTACMQFLNPFRLNKTATAPNGNSIVLGEQFQYDIAVLNVSLADYEVSQIQDYLPYGFYEAGGGSVFTRDYSPPAALPASGSLNTSFTAIASSVPQDICNKLPANVDQAAGSVRFTLVEPPQTWVNAGAFGGIFVHPHIQLANWTSLPGAAPGELVTYTIALTNNTSNHYTNLRISDTLPTGPNGIVNYAWMAPGSIVPAPAVNGQQLVWTGLTLPPDGTLQFTFVATATLYGQNPADNMENKVAVFDDNNLNTCIPFLGSGTGFSNAKPGARINIRFKNMEYSKTASPLTVSPLGLVQYNVNVTNRGPYPVYDVIVTDLLPSAIAQPYWRWASDVNLPSGVTRISDSPPAWRVAVINTTSALNFSFKARATIYPAGNYLNFMDGLAAGWAFTRAVNYFGAPVTIVPGAALDKVASASSAFAGDRIVYTVTLYNQSSAALTSIRITDTLPAGFTYDGMFSPAYPTPDTISPLVWGSKLPTSLGNNTKLELVFYARISPTLTSGTYYNRVAASAANIQIPPTDDTAPVKVRGAPNVSTVKMANPSSTYRGGTTAYTITLTNEDEDPMSVVVTDVLPAGLSFVAPLGDTPLPDQVSPLRWDAVPLAGDETKQLSFTAFVATDAPTGTAYNQVDVSSGTLRFAGTGPTAPIYIAPQPEYDLQVSQSGDPLLITLGERVTYTINYRNLSDDGVAVNNVVLNDAFPSGGITYVDGSGWVEAAPGLRTLNLGSLPANASGQVTLVLQIDPSYVGDYLQNTVSITGTPALNAIEVNAANDTASALTFIGAPPQVSIEKSAAPTLVFAGEPLMYVMTLTNQSTAPLTLRVTDTMPAGFVYSRTEGLTPSPAITEPLRWENLALPAGQSITLRWSAVVAPHVLPGFYANDVALDANGLPLPGAVGLAQVETDIRRYYDLHLLKTDHQAQAMPGSIVTYTLRYTNTTSNVTLTQVALTDIFSPNEYLTFLGAGWTQTAPGVYTRTLPDLIPGASDSLLVLIQVSADLPDNFLSVTNTATIVGVPVVRATETNPVNNTSADINVVQGADVAVTGLQVGSSIRQGLSLPIIVTVQNQGLDATLGPDNKGWFGMELYFQPAGSPPPAGPADHTYGTCPTPTAACKYVKAFNGAGLASGESFTVTYSPVLLSGGTLWLYVQADPYWNVPGSTIYGTPTNGRIVEGNEQNNIYGPFEIYVHPAVYLPLLRR